MKCGNHPERDSVGTCARCGTGVCSYCQTAVEGKVYCPTCVEKVFLKTGEKEKPAPSETVAEELAAIRALSADEGVPPHRPNPLRGLPRIIIFGLLFAVVGGSIYAAIFLPAMWTAEIGKEFQEHKYVLELGRGYAAGGDGHKIELFDNPEAKDPTWAELVAFLEADTTDEYQYTSVFKCGDYAEIVHNNAEAEGIRAGFAVVYLAEWDELHGINAFDTVDEGLVYIDCTGPDWEPYCSADKIVDVEAGYTYMPELIFPCVENPDYTCENLGIVSKVKIHW
jgi:DNA-directed RNA polymerase subunit RPC12/RpoP